MPNKKNIEDLIVHFLKQEINEVELHFLESWLEESMENKAYFFQLKDISDRSQHLSLSTESMNEKSWQKMKKRMLAEKTKASSLRKRRLPNGGFVSYFKYTAIILFVFGIGWGMSELKNLLFTNENISVYNEISVQKGGRANTLCLSDGSRVILNAATKFRYPANFTGDTRTVYLEGEAFFDVAKDEKRPFVVKVERQDITVLGTTFNVEAYKGLHSSVITLLSGKVALKGFNEKGKVISEMILNPNQKAFFDNKSDKVSVENVNAVLVTSWVRGEFKFKDAPLAAITKHLENYYNVDIYFEDRGLGYIKYTGTFSLDQNIEEVLKIINYDNAFCFKKTEREIYISKN